MKNWTSKEIDMVCESVGGNPEAIIRQLQSRLEEYDREIQEQCRIIGMGAERELSLISKVEKLEKENKYLNDGCAELEAYIQSLNKENASLKQDATRYQWCKRQDTFNAMVRDSTGDCNEDFDLVIDTATRVDKENNA